MKKAELYIEQLSKMKDWDAFLLEESGLPGPRANLELVEAVAMLGNEETFLRYISYTPEKAKINSKEEFLALCGTVGLGRLIKEGKKEYLKTLKLLASDSRWRVREGVAMALQLYGEGYMSELIIEMQQWAEGSQFEQRAAAAALCEPKLLKNKQDTVLVLQILDRITSSIEAVKDRKSDEFNTLKKGMAYCWSVAICEAMEVGKSMFEPWLESKDKDVIWILKENLKKNRLIKIDKNWVEDCKIRLELKLTIVK